MMKNNIHFSRQALADLDDIWDYIAHKINNPIAAGHTTEGILHAVEQLEFFPGAGKTLYFSNGINSGYRFIVYKKIEKIDNRGQIYKN